MIRDALQRGSGAHPVRNFRECVPISLHRSYARSTIPPTTLGALLEEMKAFPVPDGADDGAWAIAPACDALSMVP